MERSAFLARVQDRLAGVEAPPLPDALPRTFASGDGRLFDRFLEEIGKVGGEARRIGEHEIAQAVEQIASGVAEAVVADGLEEYRPAVVEGLARVGCEALEPTREAAARAGMGITGADLVVASTGSVLIRMGPAAPRVASLLPPIHMVLVPEERLVAGFEELFVALAHLATDAAQTVLITGASRTGDIELTLVRGVHGPMKVVVLVVTT